MSATSSLNKQLYRPLTHLALANEGLEGPREYHTHVYERKRGKEETMKAEKWRWKVLVVNV